MKLPPQWHTVRVSDLGKVVTGNTPPTGDISNFGGPIPFVTPGDMGKPGLIQTAERSLSISGAKRARLVPRHSTLVVCIGSTIGKISLAGCELATNQQINAVVPAAAIDGRFAYYEIGRVASTIRRLAGTQAVPIVSKGDFEDFPVTLPPLPEQQKIADILGTWDEALGKLDALIAAKARRKQALTQQLLSGRSTKKKWPRVSLSEVAEACSIRNGDKFDRTRLYAVTKAEGMVPMRENVQGATINRCQIVERGWFAYNPMRINIGSIARWESDDPVMVSPDYVVFKTDESRLLSDYLNHVRRGIAWSDFVGAAGNGSVRVRIWFEDLGCFKFPLPSIPEQRAIANVLDAADAELRLLRQQRAALDHQKRGLMQQLLTGKVRVST